MAISPADGQKYARSIRALYEKSESEILEKIAKRVAKGMKTTPDTTHWLDAKLKEVRRSISEIDRVLVKLSKDGSKAVQNLTIQGYISGMLSADLDLGVYDVPMTAQPLKIPAGNVDPASIVGSFGATHVAAVNALVAASTGGLTNAHAQILRSSKDAYRNVINDILGSAVGGVDTRQQATQKALNKFADTGIGYFKDKNNKKWDLSTYAEMATRTGMAHAHIEGHVNRMVERGYDLVIVSDHPEESPLCRPHEGQVYSVKGDHPTYKSLQWAIANGLFHPNCRHTINAYIEGLTEPPQTTGDPKGYEIRKHHRSLERKVKFWKKRGIVAVTEQEKKLAHQKIKHWQAELRTFTAYTERRRMYTREQVHLATFKLVDKDASHLIKVAAKETPEAIAFDKMQLIEDGLAAIIPATHMGHSKVAAVKAWLARLEGSDFNAAIANLPAIYKKNPERTFNIDTARINVPPLAPLAEIPKPIDVPIMAVVPDVDVVPEIETPIGRPYKSMTNVEMAQNITPSKDLLSAIGDDEPLSAIRNRIGKKKSTITEWEELIENLGVEQSKAVEILLLHQRMKNNPELFKSMTMWEQNNFVTMPPEWVYNSKKDHATKWIGDNLKKHGFAADDHDGYFAAANAHLKKLINEGQPTIRVSPSVLEFILGDGRFKTQFETKTSNGMMNPDRRRRQELQMFGAPNDLPDGDRPVYGLMDGPSGQTDQGGWYGSIKVRMNPETIKYRTTMSMGDSLDYDAVGMRFSDPDTRTQVDDILSAKTIDKAPTRSYSEIQIFGGVSVDDIKGIDISRGDIKRMDIRNNPNIRELLNDLYRKGVKITIWEDLEGNTGKPKKMPWANFQVMGYKLST